MIAVIAAHQIRSFRRQRVLPAFVAIVAAMTAMAGVIGWSSHRTIVRVYDQAVVLRAADGQAAPPNPFELKPTLSLLSNMTIYIPLIGALLAIVVGHLSLADDQATGLGRLIFSRPLRRSTYAAGKLAGVAIVLGIAITSTWAASILALDIANGSVPGRGDIARLTIFSALSWLYLMVFAVIGMVMVVATRRRSLALLNALGIWLAVTFAIPQLTSGLRPTTSLNPITDPVSTSQAFFRVTAHARRFSISEQYKAASASILRTNIGGGDSTGETIVRVLPIVGLLLLIIGLVIWLVVHHDSSKSAAND